MLIECLLVDNNSIRKLHPWGAYVHMTGERQYSMSILWYTNLIYNPPITIYFATVGLENRIKSLYK